MSRHSVCIHTYQVLRTYHIMGLLFRQKGTLIFITLLDNHHLRNDRCVALTVPHHKSGFQASGDQSGLHEFKRSILATDKLQHRVTMKRSTKYMPYIFSICVCVCVCVRACVCVCVCVSVLKCKL